MASFCMDLGTAPELGAVSPGKNAAGNEAVVNVEDVDGSGKLSGKITDKGSMEGLVGVSVYFPDLSRGTITDMDGNYSLDELPKKKVTVQVSYLGHKTIVTQVDLATTDRLDFQLEESDAQLQEVVVTGLTGRTLRSDSPAPISVVDHNLLTSTPSTNIVDAIRLQPGISQITTGGGISKPVIRGLGFTRVVVVNDGVRQEGNQWGEEHGIEVDPQSVSSVEIMKGPASLMYGSDAMGGVIIFHNEILPPKGKVSGNVTSGYQTNNGLFNYSVNAKGNNGGIVWSARWSDKMAHAYKNSVDNYVQGSQFRERAAEGLVGVNRRWGYSHLTLDYYHITPGIVEGERGDSHGYGAELPFQQVHHYKAVSDSKIFLGNGMLQTIFAYQQNRRQEFEESKDEPGLDFMLHTVNYDVKYKYPATDRLDFAAGVNGMWQHSLNKGDEFLIPAYRLFDMGAFSTMEWRAGRWTISGGLRYDLRHLNSYKQEEIFNPFSRDFNGVTGSLGAVLKVNDKMNVRLNVARGFRAPCLNELASNGVHEGSVRYEVGNHDLDNEFSWQGDLGWDYTSSWLSASLSLFANHIDNYIFTRKLEGIKTEGYDTYRYVQGEARILGGEAYVDLHPVERLHFANAFSYVNSVQPGQPKDAKYLPYTPAPRLTSDLRYDFIRDGKTFDNTFLALQMECNFRQRHFYALGGTETPTPSYTLFNIMAGSDLRMKGRKVASLYVSCDNVFDRAYQSHLSRLKYVEASPDNGRAGIFNMGRNFTVKLVVPLDF